MKIEIESTSKIVQLMGVPCRVWEGTSEQGVKVICFISRVAISSNESEENQKIFEQELQTVRPPSVEAQSFPLRLII